MPRLDFRTTDEIKEMLQKIAEHDKRSMTAEIEWLIEQRCIEVKVKDVNRLKPLKVGD